MISPYASFADLGGRKGLGPVVPERNEPWFHAPWEKRAFALTLAMGATGCWSLDASRAARERLPNYLELTYFQIWTAALTALLAERGLVTPGDLTAGRAIDPAKPIARVLRADRVDAVLATGTPTERAVNKRPRFSRGDRVRALTIDPAAGHTRLPRYTQGRVGVVTDHRHAHVFPDKSALGLGETPEHLYTVRFAATDLFGAEANPADSVSIDAFEPYLEFAP